MQEMYDHLQGIDTKYATTFDWAITLASSLPSSWDIFVQTLNTELDKLGDPAKWEEVAKNI
jgi:hypothetical protein